MVAFQVQLEVFVQAVFLHKVQRRSSVEVVLVRSWFLWLRFQQHLSIKADFVCVVLSHVEELGNV